MHRFFVKKEQIQEPYIKITGSDVNHIKNVLRMRPEEEITVSDGEKMEYRCYLESLEAEEITAHIKWKEEAVIELPSKIYLFQGLPKNDKMELIIQKTVELGVAEIIPVATKRAVVKLDGKKEAKKIERWQQISQSAAKQSKRMYIPQVKSVMNFAQALEFAKSLDVLLIPYELAEGMNETRRIMESIKPGQSVGVFIGPEGGFAEEEVQAAMEQGAKAITLGRRILRTETAGLTTLSILMYHLEQDI
ncbi:MAG: 16S rRNA (uracil(1498)-N(3))-methyltransferase [Lachnospiraceae bacterium]|nr:16S rRNA (uracil(1498)-N(3))-methyltransferase [Lachnospiraceae bacterium]MDD3616471.1 16S rRNA (uracil(1498)-N(3))-methyltransferase [Lachnospiraceae bacterium]